MPFPAVKNQQAVHLGEMANIAGYISTTMRKKYDFRPLSNGRATQITGWLLCCCLLWFHPQMRAQSGLAEKCSPPLRAAFDAGPPAAQRSGHQGLFTVVVHDLPAFEAWARQNTPAVHACYPPARILVLEDRWPHFRDTVLARPEVLFADFGALAGREEVLVPGHNLFASHIAFVHARQPALDGAGATVSIKEFRFDSADVDFKDRYVPGSKPAPLLSVHAGIMATLAAGAGNAGPAGRGVSRGCRLVSSSFVGLLPDPDDDYEALDIGVQNHSYGLDIENYYGAGALAYDQSTQIHPEILHVFSAGNSGAGTPPSGVYAQVNGFANLTGNFKMAKNVLVVGAVDSFRQVTPFSSRGPAFDGRIKPDLVAFGQDGSSGAAALVSGSAAVLRQAFFEKYGYHPGSDLLRAILTGSADDILTPGPDFVSGFGHLNLKKAVELVQHQFMANGTVAEAQSIVFTADLPANMRRLKITLCWNDLPALPNAAKALVNDLDLRVQMPDGSMVFPQVLNIFPHADSLSLPARPGRDSLNTVEQAVLPYPPAGTYQIMVDGYAVSNGSQPFALAMSWDTLGHFEWTCPLPQGPAYSGEQAILYWETALDATAQGSLEWKPAGSLDWQVIDPAIALHTGFSKWVLPDTFTPAQVRMRIGAREFVSDTFLIAPELRMQVGFDCPDSFLVRWNSAAPDASYRLWALQGRYLQPLLTVSDTFIVLKKTEYPQARFAVSARAAGYPDGGVYSNAPDIAAQSAGCFIQSLLAQIADENRVELSLRLGSLYGIRKIWVEKYEQDEWAPLCEEQAPALETGCTDFTPAAGTNTYRARLEMENGGTVTGEPVTVYFAGENGYLVLPNPVAGGNTLFVISRFTDDIPAFTMYDLAGRFIFEKALDDTRTEIVLPHLPPGYYSWQVTETTNRKYYGKLLIR